MNAEFEKYWKSSRASDRPFAETNAQILDKMIAKTHFLAGAATGYANGVAVMKERCAEVAEKMTRECPSDQCPQYSDADDCMYKDTGYCIANAIRRLKI